jgi:predicted nuclease with TOPRIM domain
MKSAYELAMERFAESDPDAASTPLSKDQKAALADLDQRFKAKIAEREVFLQKQLKDARAQGDREALEQIQTQLRNERARLEDEREREKEKVRQGS